MSFDAAVLRFFANVQLDESESTWFEEQLLKDLPQLASSTPWPSSPSGCPLADMGNYLVRVLHILAAAAESLLSGDFISHHIDEKLNDLVAEDDLHTANLLDDKHAALKEISDKINQALKDCERSWSSIPPILEPTVSSETESASEFADLSPDQFLFGHIHPPLHPSSNHPNIPSMDNTRGQPGYSLPVQEGSIYGQNALGTYSPYLATGGAGSLIYGEAHNAPASSSSMGASTSEGSPEDANPCDPAVPPLEQLKSRGKGTYSCPYGGDCKRGGVQPNGELVVFTRNSAFRAHLQLHERTFKCDIPGCTNTKGFARIDQLERHKRVVQHKSPGNVAFMTS